MKPERRIRYAVIGLGHIAQVAILPAFATANNSELAVLITDDPEKAEALGEQYDVPVRQHFEDALREFKVDAVFIALPNSMHREYTERAARAGVHVLCEKPLAVTEDDCAAMINACAGAGVYLMTAYRLHFTDAHICAIELAKSGDLGELRYFNSLFAMQVQEGNIRVQEETGGGPLYDIGIYCINAARYLFQDEPVEVHGCRASRNDPRFAEVPEMVTATLKFPGDRLASFTCSFGSADMDQLDIVGTECALHIEPCYGYSGEIKLRLKRHEKVEEKVFPAGDQFAGEIVYFSNCILTREEPEPSGEEGLADIRIIRGIMQSAKTGETLKLEPVPRKKRPGEQQLLKFPPVKEPELVNVSAPAE